MAANWRTVRVFISSTFRDMHAERDHLIKAVFPELREKLEAHRIHLVDIDLRWGVTAEQSDNDLVLDLCLDEWDAAKPNPEDATLGRITGLEEFGDWVQKDLWEALTRQYPELLQEAPAPARPGTEDWLAEEEDLHERFIESRLQVYAGRDKAHQRLMEYLQGDSTKPLLVSGGSGSGKSSILARLWQDFHEQNPEALALPHFIGASPSSTDVNMTLRRLCLALKDRFKPAKTVKSEKEESQVVPIDVPDQIEKLPEAFREFLHAVPEDGRAVLILDAVNQLNEYGGGHDMTWLPDNLPPRVKIIASCMDEPEKEQAALSALRRRETPELKVEPLTNEERFEIVSQLPSISAKILDPGQVAMLLENPATTNPLYLTVALEELRGFGSFEKLNERIRSFPKTEGEKGLVELFLQVLDRLERELGTSTVYSALSSIATSRYGLSEKELAEFHNRIKVDQEGPTGRSSQMLVALRQLRPYLLRRGPYIDFYRRNLYKAVRERYLWKEEVRQGIHHALAEYFNAKGLKSERMLSETAHHMREAGMWESLEKLLTDLRFVEAKCAAGMTHELVADYSSALEALPEAKAERLKAEEHLKRIQKYTEDLIAYSKGELPTVGVIPSVRPWTDEEIEADSTRIINNPSCLDRIKAFAQFVASESHALVKFGSIPGFCIQHAYNFADSGPVGRAAEALVSSEADKTLVLHLPFHRLKFNPHPALLRTIEGSADCLWTVSMTPDGKKAVSGSLDGSLRVWDLETGQCLRILEGHTNTVDSVSITPDGKRAVSGSEDKYLRVWDIETGRCRTVLEGHTSTVWSVSITPDGRRAVSGSEDETLRVWDLETGRCLAVLEGHTNGVWSVSITPDGKKAVSGSSDTTLRVWDIETCRCLAALDGHGNTVESVSMTPDGKRAVSGSADNTLRVWDLETGRCLAALERHERRTYIHGGIGVSITPDGKLAVSGSGRAALRVWDLETGRCLRTLEGHTNAVGRVSMTPDGKRAVSASKDNTLRVWDLEAGCCLRTLEGHTDPVFSVSVTPGGEHAVSGSSDKTLRIWDIETGRCLRTLEGHTDEVRSVSITPGGKQAVSVSRENTLRVWDLETGRCVRILEGHARLVLTVSITPDGKRAVSGGRDNALRVWDLESGRCLRILQGHRHSVMGVSVTPDGKRAVSGSEDKTLRVWDLESGLCLATLHGLTREIYIPDIRVSITPDGKRAVSGGMDKTPRVWDLETGRCLAALEGHTEWVLSVSITPDGKKAVSGSMDKTLRVWDLETGRCLRTLEGHSMFVRSVSITPDGKLAFSGSDDSTLRAWDLASGRCVAVYQARHHVYSVNVKADGVFVLSAGNAVAFLRLRNIRLETPILSATRIWLFSEGNNAGQWEAEISAACPRCGQRFPVPAGTLELIGAIARNADLKPGQSPCLELPAAAWDEPGLVSECPRCHKPLKYNPFLVDGRDSGDAGAGDASASGQASQTPEEGPEDVDKSFIENTKAALQALAKMQETYKTRHGRYADGLTALASQAPDLGQFARDFICVFRPGIYMDATADFYLITGQARDSKATAVTIVGPPARFQDG